MISFNVRTTKDLASALKEKLHEYGYSTWLCLDLDAGSNFRSEIVLAATSSRVMIPLINEAWANSKECQYEINIAQRNYLTIDQPVIMPILVDSTIDYKKYPLAHGILCNTNAVLHNNIEDTVNKMISAIKELKIIDNTKVTVTPQNMVVKPEQKVEDVYMIAFGSNGTRGKLLKVDNLSTLKDLKEAISTRFQTDKIASNVIVTLNNGVECDIESDIDWLHFKKHHQSVKSMRAE